MSARTSPTTPRQVTSARHGHILTNTAVWSPDGQWIVYDVRSDPAGAIFDGKRIERVHVATGRVEVLYESRDDACCGVVTYHPSREEVVFILGPERPTREWHYSACHRQGVIVDTSSPGIARNLDARDIVSPFTPGALRGGSHVHVFNSEGRLVSFTYEDHVLAELGGAGGADLNQRNVGISIVGMPVTVPKSHPRNQDGNSFSMLVTQTANDPIYGSDEISRAYEDAWIGTQGYIRQDGSRQTYALAFLGDISLDPGRTATELFVVDLPSNFVDKRDELLEGTLTRRPAPPFGTVQRRITFTADRKYPGIRGPRHWPRSSADGNRIGFLMGDDAGYSQLWTISPLGTKLRQLTNYPFAIASAFSWHSDGVHITFIADGSVRVVNTDTGASRQLTSSGDNSPRPEACVFSPDGSQIAYVQPVVRDSATWNQIFVVESGLT